MRLVSTLEMKVGALIIAGIAAVVGMVIVSDRLHFDKFYEVSAYLADAGGLRANSPVTLSGIRIGTVENLSPVSDTRGVIKAHMRINQRYPLPTNAQLTVSSSGIFGDSYLAFTALGPAETTNMPMDGSAEVIAKKGFLENASTQAEHLLSAANELMAPDMRAEMKRLITNAADLAQAGTALAKNLDSQNRQLADTLSAVRILADELRARSIAIGQQTENGLAAYTQLAGAVQHQAETLGPRIAASLEHIDALTKHGGDTLTSSAADLHAALASITELSSHCTHLVSAIESGQGVVGKLIVDTNLARDVDSISVDVARTAAYLAEHPEAAVFGLDKKDKNSEREKREREKSRRSSLMPPPSGIQLEEHASPTRQK